MIMYETKLKGLLPTTTLALFEKSCFQIRISVFVLFKLQDLALEASLFESYVLCRLRLNF